MYTIMNCKWLLPCETNVTNTRHQVKVTILEVHDPTEAKCKNPWCDLSTCAFNWEMGVSAVQGPDTYILFLLWYYTFPYNRHAIYILINNKLHQLKYTWMLNRHVWAFGIIHIRAVHFFKKGVKTQNLHW